MRKRLAYISLISAAVAIAACSSFSSSSLPEATSNGSESDGGVSLDASIGIIAVDASPAPIPPCAGHSFCASFDAVQLPEDGWSFRLASPSASLLVSTEESPPSSPNAFRIAIPPAQTQEHGYVNVRAPSTNAELRFEVSVFLKDVPSGGVFLVRLVTGDDSPDLAAVGVACVDSCKLFLSEALFNKVTSTYSSLPFTVTDLVVPKNAWTKMAFTLDLSNPKSDVRRLKAAIGDATASVALKTITTTKTVDLSIGAERPASNGPAIVFYDDITADW